MGFSLSGSAAIVFVGLFIAFGTFYSASTNTMGQVTDANSDWQDRRLAQHNTQIDIVSAVYDNETDSLVVEVNNTGATTLSVEATDLLVDNEYRTAMQDRDVDDDSETDIWASGQRLTFSVSATSQPDRVKVVTENGVAATEVVTRG
ncbi:flagellin [Halapricum desulfuricans]|uniref:Archaellum protein F, flagellin of FlaG/FlaF family n=1 Tax=Halapricum desulfuricans TaxID=2841257 RepID=A0A897NHE5_9EURY|nr:flagellin [Halapricum desulfuricans]QSG10050.1 Archaellum protein F, flagellin of FlaG/FlaF family [Halapricum desulfuricans]QSG10865.1 Archaellum protein F, flagellin of FlaG/FlaF family [Halapricum desulfuricans]